MTTWTSTLQQQAEGRRGEGKDYGWTNSLTLLTN